MKCPQCDEVLRGVPERGLADKEMQLDLLGEQNQNMSLEEVFKVVESKEAGKRYANYLFFIFCYAVAEW